MLSLAAALEARSEHPIGRAIAGSSFKNRIVEDFRAIPGRGVEGVIEGKRTKVVSSGYIKEEGIELHGKAKRILEEGKTLAFVLVERVLVGAIVLDDVVRAESKQAVAELRKIGIRTVMLTGDNEKTAMRIAEGLGIDEYYAEVLPHMKAEKVAEIKKAGQTTLMVGDGINDAPALAAADVGVAIGAGTDIAIESADVILVHSNPYDVVSLITLSKSTYRKMLQNLFWASGYNIVALPLAAGVLFSFGILLSPALGAVFMSLSTVIVAVNASLLKFGN